MSWSDTTPAPNLAGTHSYLAAVRETDRMPPWHLLEVFMTLQKAKSMARHLGLTLRQLRSGNYRVNFRDGNKTTAYYTDKLEDAVDAVVAMAHKRTVSSDCQADRTRAGRARLVMTAAFSSCSDEQMFGAKQQVPHGLRSDQEA